MNSPAFALPEGTVIKHYKLLKAIGQGNFGISYIGWDINLRRNVVLKENFPQDLCYRNSDTGTITPFNEQAEGLYRHTMELLMKEARTLASLNHESIVKVYDVFQSNGSLFYVMPYLEGGTLRDRMDTIRSEGKRIAATQATTWLIMLLEGLEYLHGKNIYHRDIKPENIVIDEHDRPILIDFGAALNKDTAGTTTIKHGDHTLRYASPEQITGKGDIGAWSDMYTLAATWYELISGIPPEPADRRLMRDDLRALSRMKFPESYRILAGTTDHNLQLASKDRCQHAVEWKRWLLGNQIPPKKALASWVILFGLVSLAIIISVIVFKKDPAPKPHPPITAPVAPVAPVAPAMPTEPMTPPTPDPLVQTLKQASPAELKDALYQKVKAHFNLDDYLAKAKAYDLLVQQQQAKCQKEMDALEQKFTQKINQADTANVVTRYEETVPAQLTALADKWKKALDALNQQYLEEVGWPLRDIRSNVISSYPATNMEEEVLLPAMEDRILKATDDVKPDMSFANFSIALGDMTAEKTASLLALINKKQAELSQREEQAKNDRPPLEAPKENAPELPPATPVNTPPPAKKPDPTPPSSSHITWKQEGFRCEYSFRLSPQMELSPAEVNAWLKYSHRSRAFLTTDLWATPRSKKERTAISYYWQHQNNAYFTPTPNQPYLYKGIELVKRFQSRISIFTRHEKAISQFFILLGVLKGFFADADSTIAFPGIFPPLEHQVEQTWTTRPDGTPTPFLSYVMQNILHDYWSRVNGYACSSTDCEFPKGTYAYGDIRLNYEFDIKWKQKIPVSITIILDFSPMQKTLYSVRRQEADRYP